MNLYDLANRLTLNIFDSSERQKKIDSYNEQNNLRAWQALQHQIDYDTWSKQFAQNQFAYQQQMDAKQYQLATSPVSTLIKDAASVGISPMAALGQNVGSVSAGSVGIPSSSVQNAQMSVPSGSPSSLASSLGLLSNIVLENKRLKQQDKQFEQSLEYQYQKLEQDNLVRRELGSARAALDALDLNYLRASGSSRQENEILRNLKQFFTFVTGSIPSREQLDDLPDDTRTDLQGAVREFLSNPPDLPVVNSDSAFDRWLEKHPRIRNGVHRIRKALGSDK